MTLISATKGKTHHHLLGLSTMIGVTGIIVGLGFADVDTIHKKSVFVHNIHDASYDCEDRINRYYQKDLISKYFDGISSHYEADTHQYIIYYRVSARKRVEEILIIQDYIARCVVRENQGYVSEFRSYVI